MKQKTSTSSRSFTLIEVLIVVAILGVLGAIVVSQYVGVSVYVKDMSVRSQLRTIRQQIALFRGVTGTNPRLVAKQWNDLVVNDYLSKPPINALNGSTKVKGAAQAGAGWVWRPAGTGGKQVFATDETTTAEIVE